jgi:hypothetical protein
MIHLKRQTMNASTATAVRWNAMVNRPINTMLHDTTGGSGLPARPTKEAL